MKIFFKIIKSLLLIAIIVVSFSNSVVYEFKINNNNPNKTVDVYTMAMKITEFDYDEIYSAKDSFIGDLTGYAYNCPLCNGTLACLRNYNIKDGTTTFNDETYGSVSIVASSANLPCGSIIRFSLDKLSSEPMYAIVLDRGVGGNDLDLLTPSEDYARSYVGRNTLTYDVLRTGW